MCEHQERNLQKTTQTLRFFSEIKVKPITLVQSKHHRRDNSCSQSQDIILSNNENGYQYSEIVSSLLSNLYNVPDRFRWSLEVKFHHFRCDKNLWPIEEKKNNQLCQCVPAKPLSIKETQRNNMSRISSQDKIRNSLFDRKRRKKQNKECGETTKVSNVEELLTTRDIHIWIIELKLTILTNSPVCQLLPKANSSHEFLQPSIILPHTNPIYLLLRIYYYSYVCLFFYFSVYVSTFNSFCIYKLIYIRQTSIEREITKPGLLSSKTRSIIHLLIISQVLTSFYYHTHSQLHFIPSDPSLFLFLIYTNFSTFVISLSSISFKLKENLKFKNIFFNKIKFLRIRKTKGEILSSDELDRVDFWGRRKPSNIPKRGVNRKTENGKRHKKLRRREFPIKRKDSCRIRDDVCGNEPSIKTLNDAESQNVPSFKTKLSGRRVGGGNSSEKSKRPGDAPALGSRFPLFFFIISILIFGVGGTCPRLCVCKWKGGKQTVECINKGLTTIPETMDPGTQVLDLTGNPLVIISREKFKTIGLTNLQRIYATRCKLVQLDDTAFKSLSNLVELDLSENELRLVPAAAFKYLPSLMRLQLSFNPITHIKDGSFRGLGYLTSLELSGCAIKKLEPLAFQGLDRLEWLKIDNNSLVTIPSKMMLPKSLHGVDIHNNPWSCDCHLQQLREWLVQYNVPSSIEPKCASPFRLRNRVIKYIQVNELACSPEIKPSSQFQDVIEGKNVSFECYVTATPEAEVTWQFNGHPLENSTFVYDETTSMYVFEDKGEEKGEKVSNLRIETVSEAHTGIFQCIAENRAGKVISNFTLRVNLPPSKPTPEVVVMNHIIYIGVALISLLVLVIILICILVIRCCRRRANNIRNKSNIAISSSKLPRDKQINNRPKSNNMPKYIQMGTPAPKINGILAETPPISVIENSPFRTQQGEPASINPDLIADGPDDRVKPPKKKVSILGVEEMDESGNRTTRKLDDIIEEGEDNNEQSGEKSENINGYANIPLSKGHQPQSIMKKHDVTQYPLVNMHPSEVPHQVSRYYDQQGFPIDYGLPRDHSWTSNKEISLPSNISPVPSEQSSLYSTIRRSVHPATTPHLNNVGDQNYQETYGLCETNRQFLPSAERYTQSYDIAAPKACNGDTSFCDCCQTSLPPPIQPDYPLGEPLGRMRGDGCSFDNLLGSCGGGGQCCYDENPSCHHHQFFDNSLPENYRPMDNTSPPPPPEGYGDSEEEDAEKDKEWREGTLSPGTRVLYSPEETYSENIADSSLPEALPNV